MRIAGALIGAVFGALLWLSGMADYDVIHRGLLFRDPHLYLMMVASVGTAAAVLWVCERRGLRTMLGGRLRVSREAPQRKHVAGGLTFGIGWAIAGTCPGAVVAMVAGGRVTGLWVMAGIGGGVLLRDTLEKRASALAVSEPPPEAPPIVFPN